MPIKKQVKEARKLQFIATRCPNSCRKKLNLLSSLKKSYAFNSYVFPRDLSTYVTLKLRQIVIFLKSYFFNFRLHKKEVDFLRTLKDKGCKMRPYENFSSSGSFDPIHSGHIGYINAAKNYGEYLVS